MEQWEIGCEVDVDVRCGSRCDRLLMWDAVEFNWDWEVDLRTLRKFPHAVRPVSTKCTRQARPGPLCPKAESQGLAAVAPLIPKLSRPQAGHSSLSLAHGLATNRSPYSVQAARNDSRFQIRVHYE